MATRLEKITQIQKKQEYYSDFLNDFESHPITHSIARVTNEESIKQAVRNLILTDMGERPFEPTVGSNIRASLFEPLSPITAQNIQFYIHNAITQHEKRINLLDVIVKPSVKEDGYDISVLFSVINSSNQITLNLILRRIR